MSPSVLLFLAVGLVVLTVGAELLVRGASRLAKAFGVSPLVVGLTVVAFGTSAPEVAVSIRAATGGQGGVALGNVVGSNIFNVLFILGLASVLAPLVVQRQLVRLDVPVMIGVSLLPLLLGLDHLLSGTDGALLLVGGVGYTALLGVLAFRGDRDPAEFVPEEGDAPSAGGSSRGARAVVLDLVLIAAGLAGLVVGARWFVESAITLARSYGVSELVIGLTLVAAGTSLPEVATSVVATLRGERDLAVGNVVGSNIFNVLIVLGAASIVAPDGLPVPTGALTFDFPIMVAVAAACLPIFFTGLRISRWEGLVFLAYYVIYLVYLFLDASTHDAEDLFQQVILVFVVPLTIAFAALGWLRGALNDEQDPPAPAGGRPSGGTE